MFTWPHGERDSEGRAAGQPALRRHPNTHTQKPHSCGWARAGCFPAGQRWGSLSPNNRDSRTLPRVPVGPPKQVTLPPGAGPHVNSWAEAEVGVSIRQPKAPPGWLSAQRLLHSGSPSEAETGSRAAGRTEMRQREGLPGGKARRYGDRISTFLPPEGLHRMGSVGVGLTPRGWPPCIVLHHWGRVGQLRASW